MAIAAANGLHPGVINYPQRATKGFLQADSALLSCPTSELFPPRQAECEEATFQLGLDF